MVNYVACAVAGCSANCISNAGKSMDLSAMVPYAADKLCIASRTR